MRRANEIQSEKLPVSKATLVPLKFKTFCKSFSPRPFSKALSIGLSFYAQQPIDRDLENTSKLAQLIIGDETSSDLNS